MQISKVNQNNNTNPAFQALVLKGFNKNKGADFAVLKALYETPLMRDRFDRDLAKGVDTVLTLTRSAKIDEFTKTHHPRTPYLGKTNLTIQSTKQPEWLLSGMANGADKSDALMNSGYDLAKQVKEFSLDDITDVASDKAVRKTIIFAIAGIICIIFFLSMAWIYSRKTSKTMEHISNYIHK